jgi:hypothetical protein
MLRSFPFTADAYYSLFEAYNGVIWPAQLIAYALGLVVVLLALRPMAAGARIALATLGLFWLWMGVCYHLLFFLQINFAAVGFGPLFVIEGLLMAAGALRGGRAFGFRRDLFGWTGVAFCLVALVAYPLLGWIAGHGWPRAAVFGVAPAPTTIFTFGVLLMLDTAPVYLAVIPLLWALAAGASAVVRLGTPEDLALLVAGVVGFGLLVLRKRR